MKNIIKQTFSVLLASFVLISVLSACKDDSGDDVKPPENVIAPTDDWGSSETVFDLSIVPFPVPDGIDWISNITVAGDLIYFTAMPVREENKKFQFLEIYVMDINVSNLRKLPNFNIKVEIPADAQESNIQINALAVDKDGNIWISEQGEFFYFPDGIADNGPELWDSRVIVMEFSRVRKLDSSGTEMSSYDISYITKGQIWFSSSAFAIDDNGNVYIGRESMIYVIDNEGRSLFNLDVQLVDRLINMQGGSIAHAGWNVRGRTLSLIDVPGRRFGDSVDLPSNANKVYSGNDEFSVIFSDDTSLYGLKSTSDEVVQLLVWLDSDITVDGIDGITLLNDGRILIINRIWKSTGSVYELIFLERTERTERPEVIDLTIAAFHLNHEIKAAIVDFNRISTTHRINVIDYGELHNHDWFSGLSRLTLEITAGNIPDMLEVKLLPFKHYVAKGLLVDLYPLIDSDPVLNRYDFVEAVLSSTEVNGGLYSIAPYFSIETMLGSPSVLGSYPGWNMKELIDVIQANPAADYPFGQGNEKLGTLKYLLMYTLNDYIDWDSGTVDFENEEFITLLEFANTLPDYYNWESEGFLSEVDLLRTGRTIIRTTRLDNFNRYKMYKAIFNGDIVFKGYPAANRNGNILETFPNLAITTACKDVDGAWEFLRTLLMEERQYEMTWGQAFPTNKNTFDRLLDEAMDARLNSGAFGWDGFMVDGRPLRQDEADTIMALIESASGSAGWDESLWGIISECASNYFNGLASVQDAVRVIQNRASRFVSEQS